MKVINKELDQYVEVGSLELSDSFIFDDKLCVFLYTDSNITRYNGRFERACINLKDNEVIILSVTQKVIKVSSVEVSYID